MCGIVGVAGERWHDAVPRALETLATRGPDGRHLLRRPGLTLGHARLAVIDLHTGDQPMCTADERWAIVYNGEIYNYAELREALQAAGCAFRTRSDTEVLLQGWAHWGEALLPRLDGMFAFALWDSASRTLVLARDRLGIKPLFYATDPVSAPCAARAGETLVVAERARTLAFGSTVAPLAALPGLAQRLDAQALRDYLAFQAPLAPRSVVRGIAALPPAHWLRFEPDSGRLELRRWWSIPRASPGTPPAPDALDDAVDGALRESMRRQLVADVPLGAFLSGGIDSSLMVRYMAESGARPLRTFSLRFEHEGFDESRHAAEVAREYGAEHHTLDAPRIDGERFRAAIAMQDQPLADPAYVMTHALAQLTREHVTVALSGDGGDELFGGYPRFWDAAPLAPAGAWQRAGAALVARGLAPAALTRRTLAGLELLRYRRAELGPYPGTRKSLAAYLTPQALAASDPARTIGAWLDLIDELGSRPDPGTLMRADLWTYLSEDCLVKTDRASMAWGLEMRVPMLGNPVLDVVLGLPEEVHAGPHGKAILRRIAQRTLPRSVWDRPKHGFSVPLQPLFTGAWREVCEAAIADCARRAPFLDARAVARLWREASAGRASRRLAYTIVVLLVWLDAHPLAL